MPKSVPKNRTAISSSDHFSPKIRQLPPGISHYSASRRRFLEIHHEQKLDIPFIALYRKEECVSLLQDPEHIGYDDQHKQDEIEKAHLHLKWHKVLWAIRDLHRDWLLLQKRKSDLRLLYDERFEEESRCIHDETRLTLIHQHFESIVKSLKSAESETEVDDVHTKFELHFPVGVQIHLGGGQCKRLKTEESIYSKCRKAGLWKFASKFGNSSEVFGFEVSLDSTMRMDPEETPEEMASDFTCAEFETTQTVLKGVRHMAALEISCEPLMRNYVRSKYLDSLELSTHPKTPDGNAIDSIVQRKPLHRFDDAQRLLLQKAEKNDLISVTFELPEDGPNKLLSDFEKASVSKSAQLWNEQRKLILQDAIYDFLLPLMEKEARSLLTSRAKSWLLMEYGNVLWNKVSMTPAYQHKKDKIKSDEASAASTVMACCWGEAETTLVMLDSYGELLDVLCISPFSWESYYTGDGNYTVDRLGTYDEKKRVWKFVADHQPSVVVIGAVKMSCVLIRQYMLSVKEKLSTGTGAIGPSRIVFGDESLGRLYENSQTSSNQLPGQSGTVKRAVALGRYLQNPLAMVATLCGPERAILSWKLLSSPFEDVLTPDEKYKMIEQVMVDVTNQVGLDINLAINHQWFFAPLQFISGLGPRKAAHLQQSLVTSGCALSERRELVTLHHLGEKVFDNAVGFLRVRPSSSSSNQFTALFDDTRIHPESYTLAQELAKEDPRKEWEEPSVDEVFHLATGLTDDAICEGRTVQARVYSVSFVGANCVTEVGLVGTLRREDYSDDGRRSRGLNKKLKTGDVITCKIKTVQKMYFPFEIVLSYEERIQRTRPSPPFI
ncbi:hypothetical protein ACLB2K_005038 [Fragaria x ananassa]